MLSETNLNVLTNIIGAVESGGRDREDAAEGLASIKSCQTSPTTTSTARSIPNFETTKPPQQ